MVPPPEKQPARRKSQQSSVSAARTKAASTARNPSRQATEQQLPMTGSAHRQEKSMSPLTDTSSPHSSSRSASAAFNNPARLYSVSTNTSRESTPWAHLPAHLQHYLDYHQSHLTYHYYFFKHDADRFLHTVFLDHALSYEPLLYAVVGFAAFRLTLNESEGKIQDFLQYYNKSVSLLRRSLQSGQKHTDSTMLTILQLAAFEVGLSTFRLLLSLHIVGIPWRLGESSWTSESCLRNASRIVHARDDHGNRSEEKNPLLVLPFRCVCRDNVRLRDCPWPRMVLCL